MLHDNAILLERRIGYLNSSFKARQVKCSCSGPSNECSRKSFYQLYETTPIHKVETNMSWKVFSIHELMADEIQSTGN